MRVVFEIDSVLRERPSGFFTYGAGLLSGFTQLSDRPEITLFCSRRHWLAREELAGVPEALHVRWAVTRFKTRHWQSWWRICEWPALQRMTGPFDVYHANHHLMPPVQRRPRVLTVHDLRRYRYPDLYPDSKLAPFEHAIKTADHFIAISCATRRDLMELFRIPEDRIDVVYHGGPLPEIFRPQGRGPKTPEDPQAQLRQFLLTPGRYFVAFSSYDKRKNIPNIVNAFLSACGRFPDDFRLVLMGRLPLDSAIPHSDRIVVTGPLSNFDALLQNACAMVFTSFFEGFGLPILEAMAAGCPVITSNCSSMPEVAGDAALLVEPQDKEAIADAMMQIVDDEPLRQNLIAAGRKRANEFSWQRAARETLNVYKRFI